MSAEGELLRRTAELADEFLGSLDERPVFPTTSERSSRESSQPPARATSDT